MPIIELDPKEVQKRMAAGEPIRLIDVRTPVEYRVVHAIGAELLPLRAMNESNTCGLTKEGQQLALICAAGPRSRTAAESCAKRGVENIIVVRGGTDAWVAAGLPVKRDKTAMSLERQVRLGAGLLVLTFSALALAVHPLFAIATLLIGCGLIVAGATGWCGMGMVLAKMPWNQNGGEQDSSGHTAAKSRA
jgi:rhodanese-related sulfurtransferase